MFNIFKSRKEEIERLKREISELNTRLETKDNNFNSFLKQVHKELHTILEKHDDVKAQHHTLLDVTDKLFLEFSKTEKSTKNSYHSSSDILDKGVRLITSSDKMVEISQESKSSVDRVKELIDNLGAQSKNTSISMNQLSERSKQIEEIVSVINKISEKTNLLAINASIEAARAGENGKGFSVVADEVRKLAENTKESTSNISALTKKIQEEILLAFESNQENIVLVKEGIKSSSQTAIYINELLKIIGNVRYEVDELLKEIKTQRNSSEETIKNFEKTTKYFDEIKAALIRHIEDADVVNKKLLNGIGKVQDFTD